MWQAIRWWENAEVLQRSSELVVLSTRGVCVGAGGGGGTESKQLRNQPTKAYRNEMEHEREQGLQTWLRAVGGVRAPPTDRTRPCRWESQGVAGKNKSVPCAVFSIVGNYVRLQ